jgi:hypothetical protein
MRLQPQGDLAFAHPFDETPFDRVLAQQFQGPPRAAFGGIGASQSDHLLLLPSRELGWFTGARLVVQGSLHAFGAEPFADFPHGSLRAFQVLGDLGVRQILVGLQQDLRPLHNAHRPRASTDQFLQLLPGLVREAYNMFLHAPRYTSGPEFLEGVLVPFV